MSLTIIRDSREQYEPTWSEDVDGEQVAKLEFGDYSAVGLTEIAALEVKWSLDDLAAACGRERERFDTMLRGLCKYPVRALIVAATQDDVRAARYTSKIKPQSIIASTWAWGMDYAVPTIWARDAAGATKCIEWWLRRALERNDHNEYAIERANKRDVLAQVAKTVREEMRFELVVAGIGQPPEHWADFDRVKLAERLRCLADEMDPPLRQESA